jgi:hypothetical protein
MIQLESTTTEVSKGIYLYCIYHIKLIILTNKLKILLDQSQHA